MGQCKKDVTPFLHTCPSILPRQSVSLFFVGYLRVALIAHHNTKSYTGCAMKCVPNFVFLCITVIILCFLADSSEGCFTGTDETA